MARNKKIRCCRVLNEETIFKPAGIPLSEMDIIELEADEIEVIRLCDYEQKSQIEAAQIMKISRGTIQRLLISGRKKILEALLYQQAVKLKNNFSNYIENIQEMIDMNEKFLRVAFSTNDEMNIEGHFGHCSKFVIFSVEEGKIVNKECLTAPEHAPGAYPKFMSEEKVNVIITGGMGHKAMDMLTAFGIEVILGAEGNIEDVMAVYLKGELKSNGAACAHHHHDHDHHHEHEHHHGEGHKCGGHCGNK